MRAAIKKVISLDFGRGSCSEDTGPAGTPTAEVEGIALLVTRDNLSSQWAPRWLQQVGLELKKADSGEEALAIAKSTRPAVFVIDAAEKDASGRSLLQRVRRKYGEDVPVIALCTSDADVNIASSFDATDIVRRQ